MSGSAPRRVDVTRKIPVRVRSAFNQGKGWLQNLSLTGAYVATPMYLLPQAHVSLQIVLREERRWVDAEAIVVWENRGTIDRSQGLLPGYGVRFISVPHETKIMIDDFLNGRIAEPATEKPRAFAPAWNRPNGTPPSEARPAAAADGFDVEPAGPPFRLDQSLIEKNTPEHEPGVFVLSYTRSQEARVGRADENLRETIGSFQGAYTYFYCESIPDAGERFARECELFHRLGGDHAQLDNDSHPESPPGGELECPVCVHESAR